MKPQLTTQRVIDLVGGKATTDADLARARTMIALRHLDPAACEIVAHLTESMEIRQAAKDAHPDTWEAVLIAVFACGAALRDLAEPEDSAA